MVKTKNDPTFRRREKLTKGFAGAKIDALLVTNPRNIFYLSGFRGEDSALLVNSAGEGTLITDSRFTEQAEQETSGIGIVRRETSLMRACALAAGKEKIARLGVESASMTVFWLEELKRWTGRSEVVSSRGLVENLRIIKGATEIAAIRQAVKISEDAFRATVAWMKPGVTELQVARYLDRTMEDMGAEGPGFPTIVAAGERPSLPHARPGDRKLRSGEAVLFDWGARWQMYNADLTRLAFLDRIPRTYERLYSVVLAAQRRAVSRVKPGRMALAIDAVARDYLTEHRHGKHFGHGLGHGVGLDVHEAPGLSRGQETKLRAGMVVTVEPGVYLPGIGGVRIEDLLLVTRTGNVSLTSLPRSVDSFLVK